MHAIAQRTTESMILNQWRSKVGVGPWAKLSKGPPHSSFRNSSVEA